MDIFNPPLNRDIESCLRKCEYQDPETLHCRQWNQHSLSPQLTYIILPYPDHTLHTSWQLSPCENWKYWKFEPAPSGNHTHPWGELWTFVLFDRDLCQLDIKRTRREDTVRRTRGSVVRPKEDLTLWLYCSLWQQNIFWLIAHPSCLTE